MNKKISNHDINYSITTIFRSRCIHCGSKPYYCAHQGKEEFSYPLNLKHKKSLFKKHSYIISYNDYFNRHFYLLNKIELIKLNPKLFKSRFIINLEYVNKHIKYGNNNHFYLMCKCGKTWWSNRNFILKNKPEIINRQAKNFLILKEGKF